MSFNENFLHYVWKLKLFDFKDLTTTQNEKIAIIAFGLHNMDAGPDFQNAKIDIGGLQWVGNVEIHLKSSDWYKHQHQKSYDNVILHVVYEHDMPIHRTDGSSIPTLELKGRISDKILQGYQNFVNNPRVIPCEGQLKTVSNLAIHSTLSRVLVERLERKVGLVERVLKQTQGSWDDAFYILMARNFGFKVNATPFELLAQSLPQIILAKYKHNPLQIASLLFGQAGFLEQKMEDDYPLLLQKEYQFLRKKHQLSPIDVSLWKFMRTRPQNFPTLRLAQFASLIEQSNHLFSKVVEAQDAKQIKMMFEGIHIQEYWKTHYRFHQLSSKNNLGIMGNSSIENLIINTVSPVLFAYGKSISNEDLVNKSLELLEMLPAEKNKITTLFQSCGMVVKTAFQSQAILQLKENYCESKKCLDCGIGLSILKR